MQPAHQVTRVEVLGIDPGLQLHVLFVGPQLGLDHRGALGLHVIEQPADEVADHVGAQGPAGAEIAEHPGHVGHAGEHRAQVTDRLGKIDRLAIDVELDVAHDVQVEAGGRDDDVGLQFLARFEQDAFFGEAVDLVGDHRGLARADALEQVAIGNEGDPLAPRPVARREVRVDVVVGTQVGPHAGQQFLLEHLGFGERASGDGGLVVQDLAAHDLVDPGLVDLQFAQHVGHDVGIAPGHEERWRALQQRDVLAVAGNGRHQRGGGGARADHQHLLALVVEVIGPGLRVHDAALVLVHARPFGRVALRMPVVALAHPKERGGEAHAFAGVAARGLDGPALVLARPAGRGDLVLVADVAGELVLVDDLAHVAQDLGGGGDRLAGPGLEAVSEGVQVAVGPDARILVSGPGAAEALLAFEHDEARARALLGQVIRAADTGNAGTDDQDVEMLGAWFGLGCRCLRPVQGLVHRWALCWSLDGSLDKLLDRSLNSSIELSIGPPSKTK